jgi:hypothetical protein
MVARAMSATRTDPAAASDVRPTSGTPLPDQSSTGHAGALEARSLTVATAVVALIG